MPEPNSPTSVKPGKPAKPNKPYPEFPLTAHPAGYWCKKIRGKLYYFGPWDDPEGALNKYLEQKDALHAGRAPRPETGAATVKDVANAYLNNKRALLDAGEITPRWWNDCRAAAGLVVARFGKGRLADDLGPDDFDGLRKVLAKHSGPVRLRNLIQRVKSIFKFAVDNRMIDRPVCFGRGFARPSNK